LNRRLISALASTTLIVGSGVALSAAASPASAAPNTHYVPGVLLGLPSATHLGAAPSTKVLTIGVGLTRPHTAAEQQLVNAQADPKSPQYRHFLTPAQFNARFGVDSKTVAATTSWLRQDGLKISSVDAGGDYITATGTIAQLDKRFNVTISSYRAAKVGTFVANATPPSVPTSLPIDGVTGLDTVQRATLPHTTPHKLTTHNKNAAAATYSGILTPRNLWKIYNEPTTNEGQGQKIGIFGEGETDSVVTQLRLFEHKEHFPKIPVRVVHTEGGKSSAYGDNTGSIEWYLDVQASTGMAPKAKSISLYFAKSLFDHDIAKSFSRWVNDKNGPTQMNASFGECETDPTNPVTGPLAQIPYGTELGDDLEPIAEPMLRQAVAEGRTLFASAGDTGSGCPEVVVPVAGAGNGVAPQPLPIVNYPAASQYAVGVGGTVITTDGTNHGKRVSEQAWMDTGGGPSHFLLRPKFQAKTSYITAKNAPCLTNYSGSSTYPPGSICRGTPDVAALSGNILGNGYFIYIDGEPSSEGGTSLSSPLTMGMWTRLQAGSRHGLGFAANTLYGQADKGAKTYARDFTDITKTDTAGTTGVSTTNGGYSAEKGYDFVSGLGALDVGHLLTDVDHTRKARHTSASPAPKYLIRTRVRMSSPKGNAVNPVDVQAGNLPAIDLTRASITTSKPAKTLTVRVHGPALSSTPDSSAEGGEAYYVYWRYKGVVRYLVAHTTQGQAPTYFAGRTSATNGYVDNKKSTVKGTFAGHTLIMTVPLSQVGSPAKGAILFNPAAISQLNAAGAAGVITEVALTADSASYRSVAASNAGDGVCVGHCATHRKK
jgi:pseudomonalisin